MSTATANRTAAGSPASAGKEATMSWAGVFFVAVAAFVGALAQSLLVPVLPALPAALHTSASTAAWVITVTVLVGAVAVPVLGRLGDLHGTRRLLLVCLAAMVTGSVVAALAPNIGWLITGRAIQGVAAGSLPLGISLVAVSVTKDRQASAVGLISGMLGVGGALGLPLAGIVSQVASYHVLFWIAGAAAALAFAGVLLGVPVASPKASGTLDVTGAGLLAAALLAGLTGLSQAGSWGWGSPWTWGLLLAAACLAVGFVQVERRCAQPLIDLTTLARRPVLLADVASVLVGFSMFGSILGTSSYVQAPRGAGYGFGASVAAAGLAMLPAGLAMLVAAPLAGRLIGLFGARTALAVGGVVLAGGWVLRLVAVASLADVVVGTAIVGLGVGLCFAALPAIINQHTPAAQNASANAVNALARSLGIALVSALCGTILASVTAPVGGHLLPTLTAYRVVFIICGLGALATVVLAVLTSGRTTGSNHHG